MLPDNGWEGEVSGEREVSGYAVDCFLCIPNLLQSQPMIPDRAVLLVGIRLVAADSYCRGKMTMYIIYSSTYMALITTYLGNQTRSSLYLISRRLNILDHSPLPLCA